MNFRNWANQVSLTYIFPIGELFWVLLLSEFLILFLKILQRFFLDLCLCLFLYFLHFLVFLVFPRRSIRFHFRWDQPCLPQPDSDRLLWVLIGANSVSDWRRAPPSAWLPGPYRKSEPVGINYVVRIFWSGFSRSGPWSGFSCPNFLGPVRILTTDRTEKTGPRTGPFWTTELA